MYILFNSDNKACLNVGNDKYGAFDCWLAGVIIVGAKLEKDICSYRKELLSKDCISCGNVHLFNSNFYMYVNDKITKLTSTR